MRGLIFILFIAVAFGQALNYQHSLKVTAVANGAVTGSCMLHGSASDPNIGGHIVAYAWRLVSGGSCTIVSPDSAVTKVTGLTKGVYVFSLKAVSSENLSDSARTTVTVIVK